VREALSQPGKVLHGDVVCPRAVLPLLVSEAICGRYKECIPAAAALEASLASGDVFDDVEDRDAGLEASGRGAYAQAINVGTALLFLMQVALTRLNEVGVNPDTITKVLAVIAKAGLRACAGQCYDLDFESKANVSLDDCLMMVELKSASIVESACRLGALIATDDPRLISSYSQFGLHLGMAAQIMNDVLALRSADTAKSDIEHRKKTLPVVFALNCASGLKADLLRTVYTGDMRISIRTVRRVCSVLRKTGAIHFALTVAESHKLRALEALEEMAIDNLANKELRAAILASAGSLTTD